MKSIPFFRTALLILACSMSSIAFSQWQWLDKDGRKVFSDRAPPPEIPAKNILKQPGNRTVGAAPQDAALSPVSAAASSGASAAVGNVPTISSSDKDLEAKKKQVADAEAAKRKAEEEKILKAKIENCARAKQAKTTFESGVRVARTNANGEREVMDDAARAAEVKRVQSIINSDCT